MEQELYMDDSCIDLIQNKNILESKQEIKKKIKKCKNQRKRRKLNRKSKTKMIMLKTPINIY